MPSRLIRPILILALGSTSMLANADFGNVYYSLRGFATQAGNAALSDFAYATQVDLWYTTDGDVSSGNLRLPAGSTVASNGSGPNKLLFSRSFPDVASFESAYTPSTYDLEVTAGTLAGRSGSFSVPAGLMPTIVPQLTGDSFSRLQDMRTDLPITLTTNAFAQYSSSSSTDFGVNDLTTGASMMLATAHGEALESFTIPAGTLVPGRSYSFYLLEYNADESVFTSGATTSPASLSGARTTRGSFTTSAVPEPATFAALGLGLAMLRRRRRG